MISLSIRLLVTALIASTLVALGQPARCFAQTESRQLREEAALQLHYVRATDWAQAIVAVRAEVSDQRILMLPSQQQVAVFAPPSVQRRIERRIARYQPPPPRHGSPASGTEQPAQPHPAQPHPAQPHPAQPHPAQPHPAQPHPAQPHPARHDPSPDAKLADEFSTKMPHALPMPRGRYRIVAIPELDMLLIRGPIAGAPSLPSPNRDVKIKRVDGTDVLLLRGPSSVIAPR